MRTHTQTAIIRDTNTCYFFFLFTPRYDYWTLSSHHHPSRPCVSQDARVTTGDDDDDDGGRKDTAAFMEEDDETFLLFKFFSSLRDFDSRGELID